MEKADCSRFCIVTTSAVIHRTGCGFVCIEYGGRTSSVIGKSTAFICHEQNVSILCAESECVVDIDIDIEIDTHHLFRVPEVIHSLIRFVHNGRRMKIIYSEPRHGSPWRQPRFPTRWNKSHFMVAAANLRGL